MMSELPPDGGTPPTKPLELALAEEANAAIKSGANPGDVTAKLHQLISHFRANPDLAQQGQEALDAGIDPSTIAAKAYQHLQSAGSGRDFDTEPVQPTNVGALEHTALAVPFVAKATAAANAGMDQITGKKGTGTFGADYQNRLDASDAGDAAYRKAHPVLAPALSIAGNIAPILATGGLSLGGTSAPMLARMGLGAAEGAGYGFIQGASDARHGDYATPMARDGAFGAVGGAAAPVVGTALGAAAKTLRIPNGVGRMADFIARQMPNSRVGQVAGELAPAIGDRGAAASEVAQRVAQDNAGGFTPKASVPGVPSLALDAGGPNVTALAGNIAGRPGAGGAQITKALTERAAQMRPSVQGALAEGSGVAPGSGLGPLEVRIANMKAAAKEAYDAAREATQGQPMQSETLDQVMQTPAGKLAYKWALAQKGNRGSPLAEATAVPEAPPGIAPEDWKNMQRLAAERNAVATAPREIPVTPEPNQSGLSDDARYNSGKRRPVQAVSDEGLFKELEDIGEKRVAASGRAIYEFTPDENFHSTEDGRPVMHSSKGPVKGVSQQAAAQKNLADFDNIEQQVRAELMKRGHSEETIDNRLMGKWEHEGEPRTQTVSGGPAPFQVPDLPTTKETAPDPETLHYMKQYLAKVARLGVNDGAQGTIATQAQGALGSWGKIRDELPEIWRKADETYAEHARLVEMANRGRQTFRTTTNPGVSNPRQATAQSLTKLMDDVASASPDAQRAAQTGAASAGHALFDQFSGASPGRVFAKSPERTAQSSLMFPTSEAAQRFQNLVAAWDAIAKKNQTILGGSPTMPRMAEEAARSQVRPSVALNLLSGNLGSAGKALVSNLSQGANSASRQRMDALIAEMLTGSNANALGSATQIAARRAALQATLREMLPTTGAAATNNLMPARQ